ncbi:MAG: selenite/tellurite reduction operon b-type cytochrome iron-sulfur cluster-binding subunit ExtO [Desulfuromusa sp.]
MNLKIALVVLFLLLSSRTDSLALEKCDTCHSIQLVGVHATVECVDCHSDAGRGQGAISAQKTAAKGCVNCHQNYDHIFRQQMTTKTKEKAFVHSTYEQKDPEFYQKNCQSCHVTDCLDCHGGDGHRIERPRGNACLPCHKGYFVGPDYYGKAPKEDSIRYQRGPKIGADFYLKMRPDIHADSGMTCADCHTMQSLISGQKSARSCSDCHQPSKKVIEHQIMAHLEKMECYACHSAWAAQEYGTFFLRVGNSKSREYFRVKQDEKSEYIKSSYLKRQDAPPLGRNRAGKISPIRPQFISFWSDIRENQPNQEENVLLIAQWKAFFPHTIQRGTPMCDDCHFNPRRFLLEPDEDKIYYLEKDGIPLKSFWNQEGQIIKNGTFLTAQEFQSLAKKTPQFTKAYVKKWENLINHVETSSPKE